MILPLSVKMVFLKNYISSWSTLRLNIRPNQLLTLNIFTELRLCTQKKKKNLIYRESLLCKGKKKF